MVISLLGNDALQAMVDGQVTTDEIFNGLAAFRKVLLALKRELTVVLLYADPFMGDDRRTRSGVSMLNGSIRMMCVGMPVVFADTGEWLGHEHFNGVDIHPTRLGHEVIARKMGDICW